MAARVDQTLAVRVRCLVLLLVVASPWACVRGPVCPPGSVRWVRSELFMGLVRSDGALVSEQAFAEFVDRTVTPALPDGFTLLTGRGQYRDAHGKLVREPSHVLIVLHHGEPSTERALEQVRTTYKRSFAQQSVLRTDAASCASF